MRLMRIQCTPCCRHPIRRNNRWPLAVLSLITVIALAGWSRALGSQRTAQNLAVYHSRQNDLRQEFSEKLQELLDFSVEKNLPQMADEIRTAAIKATETDQVKEPLPEEVQPEISRDLPADERYCRTQLRFQQREYAKELYLLSRRALNAGFPSYAYQLVTEVARNDPDHRLARRLLGFVRHGNKWVTPFESSMLKRNYVWHDEFGWLPQSHVERYERGDRYFRRQWISAVKESEVRRDFNFAWEVRTDHYLIKTNHSLERGVELGKALESFHRSFYQTFASFFNTPEQMRKLFEGVGSSSSRGSIDRPYVVHFYRQKEEYVSRLVKRYPQISITNGLYEPNDRVVYFYENPEYDSLDTLFHEATHQLFAESRAKYRPIAQRANFWIVEGIACYMESFNGSDAEQSSLGNPQHIRFDAARYQLLNRNYYLPLAEFASMGMNAFQGHRSIAANYSQASGLSHFFMHYEGGRYRDALIEHLSQIYRADVRRNQVAQSLESLIGVPFAELDRQYHDYITEMHQSLQQ